MIRFILPLLLLVTLVVIARRFIQEAPAAERDRRKMTVVLGGVTLVLVLLVFFRHLHWVAAAIASVITVAHELWRRVTGAASQQQPGTGSTQTSQASAAMSEAEALEVLGLKQPISRDDVIEAHRKLMQKFHPDRGGNDYLASKINQAKALLLATYDV